MPKPTLYLETSVISYLVGRPSRDVLVLAHQQVTHEFWAKRLSEFEGYISSVVLLEARRGEPTLARERIEALTPFSQLALTPEAESLAIRYRRSNCVPEEALVDSLHIALASLARMEYLLTWNCRHIAGARIRRRLAEFHALNGLWLPTICTPEELMEG